jgi:hypothetical protein
MLQQQQSQLRQHHQPETATAIAAAAAYDKTAADADWKPMMGKLTVASGFRWGQQISLAEFDEVVEFSAIEFASLELHQNLPLSPADSAIDMNDASSLKPAADTYPEAW